MNDRPIKMHVDEEMRAHIEFCLNRYKFEVEQWIQRAKQTGKAVRDLHDQLALTERCKKEAQEAGT